MEDTGSALFVAAGFGRESSVKFLLQQQKVRGAIGKHAYVDNTLGRYGATPLFESIRGSHPRIVRLLMDAGADTTSAVRVMDAHGGIGFELTPLEFTSRVLLGLSSKEIPPDERLQKVKAIHRLLLRVDAVHAVSWSWPSRVTQTRRSTDHKSGTETASMPLRVTFPIVRTRAGSGHCVLLPAVLRWVVVMQWYDRIRCVSRFGIAYIYQQVYSV